MPRRNANDGIRIWRQSCDNVSFDSDYPFDQYTALVFGGPRSRPVGGFRRLRNDGPKRNNVISLIIVKSVDRETIKHSNVFPGGRVWIECWLARLLDDYARMRC